MPDPTEYRYSERDIRLVGNRIRVDAVVEIAASRMNGVVEVTASLLGVRDSLLPLRLAAASNPDVRRAASEVAGALAADTLLQQRARKGGE